MPEIAKGVRLGGYTIVQKLGQGGMGAVYAATEESLNRTVALKILSEQYVRNAEFLKRFRREAQSVAQLNHPNIVAIYAAGEEDGVYFIAMEYIKGSSLSEYIEKHGPLDVRQALKFTGQIAQALHHAHSAGVVHRDIKPGNIMIDQEMRLRVVDFGLARPQDGTAITADGTLLGTPAYMSPEQCRGEVAGPTSDIFSLGVTLFEMLTGVTPFSGDSASSLMYQIVNDPIRSAQDLNPAVSRSILDVLNKMTAKNTEGRYQNAQAVMTDIKDLLSKDSSATVLTGAVPASKSPDLAEPAASDSAKSTALVDNSEEPTDIAVATSPDEMASFSVLVRARRTLVRARITVTKTLRKGVVVAIIAAVLIGAGLFLKPILLESLSPKSEFGRLQKQADRGDAEAQYKLGAMYHIGDNIDQDYSEAARWYSLSAQQGYIQAQVELALMYRTGDGVGRFHEEAIKWYREAAEHGDLESQSILAEMYFMSQGTRRDYVRAFAWASLAESEGYDGASRIKGDALKRLSPQQLKEAQKLVPELASKVAANLVE